MHPEGKNFTYWIGDTSAAFNQAVTVLMASRSRQRGFTEKTKGNCLCRENVAGKRGILELESFDG